MKLLVTALLLTINATSFAQVPKPPKPPVNRYPLPYPPTLPDGKEFVTEESADFLKPGSNLKSDVAIAKTPPVIDFLYYPLQNYPGNPWSHRSDGWLYYATDRGSTTVTNDAHGYKGEWVLRTNPQTLETRIVATHPIEKHTIPASVLDPKRMIFYGGTAVGKDAPNQKIQFFALDVKTGKLLKTADDGPYRVLIFSPTTGCVFWQGKKYDPATNEITTANVPHVRSASNETKDGWVYGTSETKADLWAYNTKTDELKPLGSGAVGSQEYIASVEVDPTGQFLYYVPGAHGGAAKDNSPIVQFNLKTRQKKIIAFVHNHFWDKYGYALDGSFGNALDEKGERFFISWDGWRKGQPRGWESCALTVVHIPESERKSSAFR